MKMIISIEDQVIGSWHQITVDTDIRLDGSTLPPNFETNKAVQALQAAFSDDFEGMTGKDVYLAEIDLLHQRKLS